MPYPTEDFYDDTAQIQHERINLFGSGRLIGRNLVLTARHILYEKDSTDPIQNGWQVRLNSARHEEAANGKSAWLNARLAWSSPSLDLAILKLLPETGARDWNPRLKLRIASIDEVRHHRVRALGFPRGARDGGRRTLLVPSGDLDDENEATLSFGIDLAYQPEAPNEDWRGFSGAAVLLAESKDSRTAWIYGVVRHVPQRFTRRLAVSRLACALDDDHFCNLLQESGVHLHSTTDPMKQRPRGRTRKTSRTRPETLGAREYALIRRSYLAWLGNELKNLQGEITLHGQRVDLPLEKVYVSVRGYPGLASEIEQAHVFQPESEHRYVEPSTWQERDHSPHLTTKWIESIDLGEAFRRHQATIILGEPGSGKTTLARWLTLAFATACDKQQPEVFVAQKAVDAGVPGPDRMASLGKTRVPIFAKIADIAKAYGENKTLGLADLLGYYEKPFPVYLEGPSQKGERIETHKLASFFKQVLRTEGAVLILDGLDEIAKPEDRSEVVELIHRFLASPYFTPTSAKTTNQILITSRIVGYDIHPLRDSVAPYTIERLSETAISAFSDSWHAACAAKLARRSESLEETAHLASKAFKDQILGSSGMALRELTSNAFLLSLLCVLNEENDQRLPTSRAKLYEALLARGLRGLYTEKAEPNYQLEDVVRRILIAVAYHMHATTSNGLLPEVELKAKIWPIVQQNEVARAIIKTPEEAVLQITERTGLLAERGVGQGSVRQYGFKHQTVQEFLAGKLLVDDLPHAVPNLLRRSIDPRWREAVLLGLGSLCESQSVAQVLAICRELLEAKTGFVPTGAIILAQLIDDRPKIPDLIITETIVCLLGAYGQQGVLHDEARFRELVEALVGSLLTQVGFPLDWKTAAERGALQYAQLQPAQNVRVLAGLLHKCRIANACFVETLLSALHDDQQESNWIVNRALEMSAVFEQTEPPRPAPANVTTCAKLAPKTLKTLSNRELVDMIRFVPGPPRLAERSDGPAVPAYCLSFREALEESPHLITQIASDIGWLKLVLALYGGLGSFETPQLGRTLNEGRSLLGSLVIEEDEAAHTAAYLDTEIQPQWNRFKSWVTDINPKWMYRDSPLTPVVLASLRQEAPIKDLIRALRDTWANRDASNTRSLVAQYREKPSGRGLLNEATEVILLTDCLVGLLALDSIENHPAFTERAVSGVQAQALHRFAMEPNRILSASRDPILRFRGPLERAIATCSENSNGPNATSDAPAPPPSTEEPDWWTFPQLSDDIAQAAQELAHYWEGWMSARDVGSMERLATVLDVYGKALTERTASLFISWLFVLDSPWSSKESPGLLEACLRISRADPDSTFVRCVGGIGKLPQRCEALKAFALSRMLPLFEKLPQLRMLALALTLQLKHKRYREIALNALLGGAEFDESAIAEEVKTSAEISMTRFPLEAFHTLRYLTLPVDLHDAKWRMQLISCARAIEDPSARAAALAQSARIMQYYPEGKKASETLEKLRSELPDDEEFAILLRFAGLQTKEEVKDTSGLLATWRSLTNLTTHLEIDPPSPLELIGTRSTLENAELLAYYLRHLFVAVNDDREYSITVVLDTVGKKLSMAPEVMVSAFSHSVRLVEEQRWDSAMLLPSAWDEKGDERHNTFRALLFLWCLPDAFDFLAAWGFSRIHSLIRLTEPDLLPLSAALAGRIKESSRSLMFAGLDERWKRYSPQQFTDAVISESRSIADPFFRFHTLRILRRSGYLEILAEELMQAARNIDIPSKRDAALLDLVAEFGAEIAFEALQPKFQAIARDCSPGVRNTLIALLALTAPVEAEGIEAAQDDEGWRARPVQFEIVLRKSNAGQEDKEIHRKDREQAIEWLETGASTIEKSEQRAALAAALVCLRCSAITPVIESKQQESLWRQLADVATRQSAIGDLVSQGRAGNLELDSAAHQAINDWMLRGDPLDMLEPVLVLISRAMPGAMPLIEEWFRKNAHNALGKWACVMLAERNRWSVPVVKTLAELLQYSGDVLRNRAVMALTFKGGMRRRARASMMGRNTVIELAEITEKSHLPNGVLMTVVWAFGGLTIDTPGLLTELRDQFVAGTSKAALSLYRLLNYVSEDVAKELLTLLSGPLPSKLRGALAHSIILLWERTWERRPDDPFLVSLRQVLRSSLDDANPLVAVDTIDALGYISSKDEIHEIAQKVRIKSHQQTAYLRMLVVNASKDSSHALQLLKEDRALKASLLDLAGDQDLEISIAAATLLLRSTVTPQELHPYMKDDDRFLQACFSSIDFYFVGDRYGTQVRRIARGLEALAAKQIETDKLTQSNLFIAALQFADRLMRESRWTSSQSRNNKTPLLGNVLPVCSAWAELMPDLYRRITKEFLQDEFAVRLQHACQKCDWFTARESAVVLLCLLRRLSQPLGRALRSVCADVYSVQQTVVRQIDRVREIDSAESKEVGQSKYDASNELKELLNSESANVVYTATRVIVNTLQNEHIDSELRELLRERWLEELSRVADRVNPHVMVSILETGDERFVPQIRNVGLLKHLLQSALVELSAIPQRHRADNVSNVDLAQVHVRTDVLGEPRSFEVWLAESPSDDLVTNQKILLERRYMIHFPQDLLDALADLAKVSKEESVSCSDLAVQAQYYE